MGTFLRKLFERYARRMLAHKVSPSAAEEGIVTIAANKRVKLWAENLYADFKKAGVPDEVIQTENDIKVFHHKIAEMNNQNITRQFESMMTPKKPADVLDLTGKKIPHGSQIMGGKEVKIDIVADTIATIKSKKPIDAMAEANSVIGRKGKYKNLTPEESKKILKDTNDHIFERDIPIDPEDLAGGGRTGYDNGKFVSDPTKKTPKNFYNLGIGPDLGKFMSEGVPRDEKGFHTTLNKEDLKYMWEVLQGKHPIKDIEDELMFRFGRVNPEKKSEFFAEIGKDKGGIGWKKKFAGGGRTSTGLNYLLGEDDQNSRVPYAGGGMGRRLFLKLMGGAAAGTAAAKSGLFSLLKGGGKKQIVKDLTSIPIKSGVDGMPVWFKPLVNKVIKDGTDVTKELGTIDRQLVHKTKLPNSKTDVYVTQDLNTGDVLVDIGSGKHGFKKGHLGQPVRLEYRASEVIEPTKTSKGTKTKEEFWVDEAEFTGGHPENIKFEESAFEKFGSHGSNFDEVEKFATGKIKKTKPLKKTKDEYALQKEEGYFDEAEKKFYEKASGGRVPLGKGKLVKYATPEGLAKLIEKFFPGTTKVGKTSKPMAEKTQLKQAIAKFQERNKIDDLGGSKVDPFSPDFDFKAEADLIAKTPYTASELKQLIIKKYKDKIDDKLLKQMLTDDDPQRLAEVMATVDEALIMQEKGMGHEEIINIFEKMKGRKPNATGGRVSLSAGGLAGMLGE